MNTPIHLPHKILVRSPNWLGDAVMAAPALMRLREKLPSSEIRVLVPEKLKGLYEHHSAVSGLLSFREDEGLFRVARRIRELNFDAALVLPNSHRSALEVWLASVPIRAGVSIPMRNWLLTRTAHERLSRVRMHKLSDSEVRNRLRQGPGARPLESSDSHQAYDYLHLAAALFGTDPRPLTPRLEVSEAEVRGITTTFNLPAQRPVLGMNPGAQYGPAKRWPAERFIATALSVGRMLKSGLPPPLWIIFGTKGEAPLCESVASALNRAQAGTAQNLAGKTSLRQLMALLSEARVLLTNDSGPMHLAAALGTPVVAIFGSTSPILTGPAIHTSSTHHRILRSTVGCSPCFRRECPVGLPCMQEITHEQAASAILSALTH